jgi:TPP-dependent 2-oxoacid decarboxylase
MTIARDAIALPETFDFLGQTVRWGHIGTAGPALMRVVIG